MSTEHFSLAIESELRSLDAGVSQMGGAAEDQLGRALEALLRRDRALAEEVIDKDAEIDAMEIELDRETAAMFSRRQLMAYDLRLVIAIIKVTSAIERVGDLAKNTARRSLVLSEHPPLRSVPAVVRLGQETLQQFSESLDAFGQRNESLARQVWAKDESLDNLYNGLQREIMDSMAEDPSNVAHYTQLLFIAKNMERIGDHATFIAEMLLYILTGEQIGDQRPKGLPDGLGS